VRRSQRRADGRDRNHKGSDRDNAKHIARVGASHAQTAPQVFHNIREIGENGALSIPRSDADPSSE
jgi:hypothetical protein